MEKVVNDPLIVKISSKPLPPPRGIFVHNSCIFVLYGDCTLYILTLTINLNKLTN